MSEALPRANTARLDEDRKRILARGSEARWTKIQRDTGPQHPDSALFAILASTTRAKSHGIVWQCPPECKGDEWLCCLPGGPEKWASDIRRRGA